MGKDSPDPIVVNPQQSATSQAAFNKEAALQQRALNMVDQYTPQGMTTFEETGLEREGIPGMKVTQTLSPEQQGLYESSTRLAQQYGDIGEAQLGQVAGTLSDPFTTESLGAAPTPDAAYRTQTLASMLARQQPRMDRERAALETSLANQGFVTGTEGYDTAMDERNRAMTDLGLAADLAAGGEMSQRYGLEASARDKAINEALLQRNQPMAELASLISGSQPTAPQFLQTPQGGISAPDFQGAAAQNALMQNQMAQRSYEANLSGLYGLGGVVAGNTGYTGKGGWTWG